jgi:putative (di)nucleoside polyphosphate hydrolase
MSVIDEKGYRENVGIILVNSRRQLFWGRRYGQRSWQFPQGGIKSEESSTDAMYRELHEEVGLSPQDVQLMAETPDWLHYRLPEHLVRQHSKPLCIGQKQKWFLLRLQNADSCIQLDSSPNPEFDAWRWVSYWYPLKYVIDFKRSVYRRALRQFAPVVFDETEETDR